MLLCEKIRKIRVLKGYSQEYMADKLKISQAAYSELENHRTKITIDRLEEVAKIFDVEVIELLALKEASLLNDSFKPSNSSFMDFNNLKYEDFEDYRKKMEVEIELLK